MSGRYRRAQRYSVWVQDHCGNEWHLWQASDGLRAWLPSHARRRLAEVRGRYHDAELRPALAEHLADFQTHQERRDACLRSA